MTTRSTTHPPDVDVLIVGAGPVGLFLANECARRGLRYRIVEARAGQSTYSKALAIFPRTLEIFDMAGVVEPFLDVANRVTSVAIVEQRHRLAQIRFAPEQSAYPFIGMVPQDVTERLLVDALRQRGGTVEYETKFVAAEEHADHVDVTLDQRGARVVVTAAFVVGCDGAHSAVRHLLRLPFEGAEYEDSFMLADVETNDGLPSSELQLCPSEFGPLAVFPMSANRRRIVATVQRVEGDAPSLELVQRLVRERAPAGLEVTAARWTSYFRIHHRHVGALGAGRIFIAGDAAHIHSPFGGQGMNTGLQDVWNLSWKLALAVRGHGNDHLLESYTAERLPVIRDVIATTDRITKIMGSPSKLAHVLRDTVIPVVSELGAFQHAFVRRLSGLGIAYHDSPIIDGAGERYFDDSVRGGAGIVNRFLLFVPDDSDESTASAARALAASFRDVVELRAGRSGEVMLLRPDGYVAFAARGRMVSRSLNAVRSLLARQTT